VRDILGLEARIPSGFQGIRNNLVMQPESGMTAKNRTEQKEKMKFFAIFLFH